MKRSFSPNQTWIMLGVAGAAIVMTFQLDLLGRVSYAMEKGKLKAGLEHLQQIDVADVAVLEQLSHAFSIIAENVKPSVVYIEALTSRAAVDKQLEELFGKYSIQAEPSTGTGSGVIIDERGYIVTNNHVVEDADNVRVVLSDGRRFRADVVGKDKKTDIAVIKIAAEQLHPAVFGDSDALRVGHMVLAIGSPFRLGHSVSHGIVSALGRSNVSVDIPYQNWIQTDAPINPGNSGGPLINSRGQIIGINTAIATESGGNQGVGFAIPSNIVRGIAETLKSGRQIVRGYLGVSIKTVDQAVAGAYRLSEVGGVLIENVGEGSPAKASGLKAEDIVLAIDGQKVTTVEAMQLLIADRPPNSEIDMSIWRAGRKQSVTVRIGEQPADFSPTGTLRDLAPRRRRDADPPNSEDQPRLDRRDPISSETDAEKFTEPRASFDQLGFEAATVSPRLSRHFKLEESIQTGAVIIRVDPTGEAFAARLRPGQVITRADDRKINNVRELEQVLTDEAIARGVRLEVRSGDTEFRAIVRVQ